MQECSAQGPQMPFCGYRPADQPINIVLASAFQAVDLEIDTNPQDPSTDITEAADLWREESTDETAENPDDPIDALQSSSPTGSSKTLILSTAEGPSIVSGQESDQQPTSQPNQPTLMTNHRPTTQPNQAPTNPKQHPFSSENVELYL